MADSKAVIVGVIMGSKSDWEYMSAAAEGYGRTSSTA